MIQVVIDTNVIVSALLREDSLPATVLMLALSGKLQPAVSDPILLEYETVLRRPYLKIDEDIIDPTLAAIRGQALHVSPQHRVDACSDSKDNMFLECAEAASADYVVTGNRRHFPAKWKLTRVIGVRELVELVVRAD